MSDNVFNNAQDAPFDWDLFLENDVDFTFDLDAWNDPTLPDPHLFDVDQSGTPCISHSGSSRYQNPLAEYYHHTTDPLTYGAESGTDNQSVPAQFDVPTTGPEKPVEVQYHTLQINTSKLHRCVVPGCSREEPFSRQYELKRHVASKHGSSKSHEVFTCRALGCYKRGTVRWVFRRVDKLTHHVRTSHPHDAPFEGCPVHDCALQACSLDVLGAHLRRAHPNNTGEARAISNATSAKHRRCPLPGCNNKLYALDDFLAHLGTHDARDLYKARQNRCFETIFFHFVSESVAEKDEHAVVFMSVACPVCGDTSPDFHHFREHFWAHHLFLDANAAAHFVSWQGAVEQLNESKSSGLPWDNPRTHMRQDQIVECPRCTHSIRGLQGMNEGLQHPSLLRPTEQVIQELGPFRMQILRLIPDFITHPIFDDCS